MTNLEKYINAFTSTFEIEAARTTGLKYQDIEAWDSVGHMGLIAALEEAFGIMLDTDRIYVRLIRDLVDTRNLTLTDGVDRQVGRALGVL